jgi:hypothetical protein
VINGRRFHLVNSALMLLKMLDDYMALYDIVPQFGAEIVHRELELLKQFNSQVSKDPTPPSPPVPSPPRAPPLPPHPCPVHEPRPTPTLT